MNAVILDLMKQLKSVFFLFCALLVISSANAQNPVDWTFTSEYLGNDEFNLVATANIQDGWYTYSQEGAEDGPVPTSFEFYEGDHYQLIGSAVESGNRKSAPEPAFGGIEVIKFSKKGVFTQKVKVSDTSKPIGGYVNYMTCDGEMCLPPKDVDFAFTVTLPKEAEAEPVVAAETEKPTETKEIVVDKIKESIPSAPQRVEPQKVTPPTPKKEVTTKAPAFNDVGMESTDKRSFANEGKASEENPVVWDFQTEKISDTQYRLVFHADIADGWALYSPFIGEDAGPIPTSFEINASDFFKASGKLTESDNVKTKFDKVFRPYLF